MHRNPFVQTLVLLSVVACVSCGWFILLISPVTTKPLPDDSVFVRSKIVNAFYQVKGSQVLLVDGGFSGISDDLLKRLRGKRVRFLVITHGDGDHIGALERLLSRPHPPRVFMSPRTLARLSKKLARLKDLSSAGRLTLVTNRLEVREAGFHFIVVPAAPAHTDEDLFVHLPAANLVAAGDLAVTGYYPAVKPERGGSYRGLRRALTAIVATGARTIVPGHGALGSPRTVAAALRFLEWAERGVRKARAAGLSRKQTIARLQQPPVKLKPMPRGLASLSKVIGELYDELARQD